MWDQDEATFPTDAFSSESHRFVPTQYLRDLRLRVSTHVYITAGADTSEHSNSHAEWQRAGIDAG